MRTTTRTTTVPSPRRLFATRKFLCALLCITATYCGLQIHAQTLSPAIPGEYIVVLKPTARGEEVAQQHGLAARHQFKHALNGFAGHIPEGRLNALQNDPRVEFIEQDIEMHALSQIVPTGIRRIGADVSPAARIDGIDERVNADIAIIDTGIDLTHPDLNVYRNVSFVSGTTSGNDDHGHGTHVAGIAAALDNNIGVVGVAPGARLWAVKVLDSNGSGTVSDVISGVDYVTANAGEIEVANMSLGGQGTGDSLRLAIQNSVAKGVVYVVAAGNSAFDIYGWDAEFGTGDDFFPAAYPEVMTVSALADTDGTSGGTGSSTSYGADDTLATFSNFSKAVVSYNPVNSPGAAIDVAAPGVNIYSTYRGGSYATLSGTSMASPHVAGAVALYVSQYGRANDAAGVYSIRQALIDSAEPQTAWGINPPNPNPGDLNPEGLINVSMLGGPPPTPDSAACSIFSPSSGVTVSGTITVSVTVSGNAGVTRVELYVDDFLALTDSATPFSFAWDTTTVGNGSHSLMAKAYDAAGSVGTSTSITVNVQNSPPDSTPPTCSISSPSSGVTVSGTITVSVTASDNAEVTRVELLVDDFFGFTDSVPPFSFVWDTTTVSNGSHTFVAKAYDAAGNFGTSTSVTVNVQNSAADTTPPTAAITTPSNGVTVSGTITPAATASDDVGVSNVEFYVDDVWQAADTTSPYSFSWDTTTVSNGSHTLLAKAYDAAGNFGTSTSVTVNVQNSAADTTPPTCAITTPSNGVTVSGTITPAATASDDVGVSKVEFYVDDVWQATDTTSPYSFSWDTASVGNGSHSLMAMAYDAAGNFGTSISVTVNVQNSAADTTPPTCAITTPSNGVTVSATITLAATASDNVGVSRVEFYVDDVWQATDTTSPYSFSWDTTTVSNGGHTLLAKAYDAAGYVGTSAAVSVTVQNSASDSLPPMVVITSPTTGSNVSGNVKVSVSATDNVSVARVELYVDDSFYSSSPSATAVFPWNTRKVGNGPHTLTARAIDDAGNVGTSSSVTVYK